MCWKNGGVHGKSGVRGKLDIYGTLDGVGQFKDSAEKDLNLRILFK